MQTRVARGLIATGEIGELAPVACVTEVGRGYAIEMYSGMMRLVYSASRAISATDEGMFCDDEAAAALSGSEAAAKIAELFKNYKEQRIATAKCGERSSKGYLIDPPYSNSRWMTYCLRCERWWSNC